MKITIQSNSSATADMLLNISPKLFGIFGDILQFANRVNYDVQITSIIRPKTTDSGVHAVGRAIDFLFLENGNVVDFKDDPNNFIKWVNIKYVYDYKRPQYQTIMWHSVGGDFGGWHFHLQVADV